MFCFEPTRIRWKKHRSLILPLSPGTPILTRYYERDALALWRYFRQLFLHVQIGANLTFPYEYHPWIYVVRHPVLTLQHEKVYSFIVQVYCCDAPGATWRLQPQTTRLIFQQIAQVCNKENIKVSHYCPILIGIHGWKPTQWYVLSFICLACFYLPFLEDYEMFAHAMKTVHKESLGPRAYQHISRVSCQKGPTRNAYAWQIGPFWQDTLDLGLNILTDIGHNWTPFIDNILSCGEIWRLDVYHYQ